jgi:hypothetical protein
MNYNERAVIGISGQKSLAPGVSTDKIEPPITTCQSKGQVVVKSRERKLNQCDQ